MRFSESVVEVTLPISLLGPLSSQKGVGRFSLPIGEYCMQWPVRAGRPTAPRSGTCWG